VRDDVFTVLHKVYTVVKSAVVWILVLPIRGYQRFISPLTPPSCKFHPSCSSYAVTAIQRHGPLKGTTLSIYRLGRCHPWQSGGLDPVPTRGRWRPDITADGRTVIPQTDLRTQRTEQLAA
jgi:uncharacterized protein